MTTQTEQLARADAGAEVLRIIHTYGDELAAEIFRGHLHAIAHGLHAVTQGTPEAAMYLYSLADDHVSINALAVNSFRPKSVK